MTENQLCGKGCSRSRKGRCHSRNGQSQKQTGQKQKKANSESGNAILSGIINIAGRGKYAEIAKENERLKTFLTEIQKEFADKYNDLAKKHNAQLSARKKAKAEQTEYKQGETNRINLAVREAVERQKNYRDSQSRTA